MRHILCLSLVLAIATAAAAAERTPDETTRQLRLLDAAVDVLNRTDLDVLPEQRTGGGENLNQAFVALTGEAVNPLFGITVLGMYNYFRTPEGLRDSLPIYDQPEIWIPLLIVIFLMLFNSTICEAIPFLKVPLNALGDIVNKAGAVAVLPLVVKMFADSVAPHTGGAVSTVAGMLFPVAHAAEGGMASTLVYSLGWLAGAAIGFIVYSAVWLTFNVVDVLILICPFPGIDALLKSFRLAIMGALLGTYQFSPLLSTLLAVVIVVISMATAGWSFRLSVFGLVFSTDIILFRRGVVTQNGVPAFSGVSAWSRFKIPVRTLGRLEKEDSGELFFSYRPWLVLGKRKVTLGRPADFSAGKGLISTFLVEKGNPDSPWLRLPPRYRAMGGALAETFGLAGTANCGAGGSLRSWLAGMFGKTESAVQ